MTNAEEIFENLIKYEEVTLGSREYLEIKDDFTLQRWLTSKVKAKGARSGRLADEISKIDRYKRLVQLNLDVYRDTMMTGGIIYTTNQKEAKERKLIYVGTRKDGRKFYYSYALEKMVKNPLDERKKEYGG